MRIFLLFFLSMFCFSSFAVNLLPDWHGKNCIAEVENGGRQYTVALKPEWRGVRLKSKMKATNILRGEESWQTGRLTVTFHDSNGKLLGKYPKQHEALGTTGWLDVDFEYLIPKNAVCMKVGFVNIGKTGTCEFTQPELKVTRGWITQKCNAPIPEGTGENLESIDDAWKKESSTRKTVSLNGWWRCRPSFIDEESAFVPGKDDCWGWSLVPSVWNNGDKTFPASYIRSPYFEDNEEKLKQIAPERAWYARRLKIPAFTNDKRVEVRFTLVNTRAVVYVDNKRAGEVQFPSGSVDITKLVRPNTEHDIAIDVTAWPRNETTLNFNAPDRSNVLKTIVKNRGLTGDVYLDILPDALYIKDSWVQCDTSENTVTFVVNPQGAIDDADIGVELIAPKSKNVIRHTAKAIRSEDGLLKMEMKIDAPEYWDVHTPKNFYTCKIALCKNGQKLDESIPFRFGFRDVKIKGRDLFLNGKKIHLRALHNVNMTQGTIPACREFALKSCRRHLKEGYNFIIAGNYSVQEGSIAHAETMLDVCDEEGLLVSWTLPHIKDFAPSLENPEVATRYRELTEKIIAMARRHPSVITYAMNHNCTGYGGDQNPMRLDGRWYNTPETRELVGNAKNRRNAVIAAQIAKTIDPTRSIYHHESGNLGEWSTLNIYLNWAPRQERSDWLENWSTNSINPLFFVEWGLPHLASWSSYRGPMFIWRCKGYMSIWAPEYASAFLGDKAYEDMPIWRKVLAKEEKNWSKGEMFRYDSQGVRTLTNLYHGVQAYFASENWRAHRSWGITAVLPWDQEGFFRYNHKNEKTVAENGKPQFVKKPGIYVCKDDPDYTRWKMSAAGGYWTGGGDDDSWIPTAIGKEMRRWNAFDMAYIGGSDSPTDKTRQYAADAKIAKSLCILNDRRIVQDVQWKCRFGNDTRSGSIKVGIGEFVRVPIEFTAPSKAGEYSIEASFVFEDGNVQEDSFAVNIITPEKKRAPQNLLLYDTCGLTTAHFKRLGIPFTSVDLDSFPTNRNVYLVIGRESLTYKLLNSKLIPLVNNLEGKVLVFEQDKNTLESIGFRVQEYGLRNVWPRYKKEGLSGLTVESLRDWAGASTLIPPTMEGNIGKIENAYPVQSWAGFENSRVWRCGNRNAVATVIPEKPTLGDWRALGDGGFDLQYSPLLEWVINRGSIMFCQFDVTARTKSDPFADALTIKLVNQMTLKNDRLYWPSPVGEKAILEGWSRFIGGSYYYTPDRDISKSSAYFVTSTNNLPATFKERIKNGAIAICCGLNAEEVNVVSPVKLNVVNTNNCYFTRMRKIPIEFNGLSNADWAWRGGMSFAAFTDEVEDGNNGFRVVKYGKGKLIFMQLAPWMIDDGKYPYLRTTRRRAEYALSRILGNLSCQNRYTRIGYADVPEHTDDPYRYIRW